VNGLVAAPWRVPESLAPRCEINRDELRDLTIRDRYATLFNAAPKVEVNERTRDDHFGDLVKKNIVKLMKRQNFVSNLDQLLSDCHVAMNQLAARPVRVIDPFEDMYRLVYQLTMRTVGCNEIADDPATLSKTLGLFESIDSGSSAAKIIFPWLPTWGHMQRLWAGTQMYMLLSKIVEARKKEGRREPDALQMLIDQGDNMVEIVGVRFRASRRLRCE
jgi:hypothetical protein